MSDDLEPISPDDEPEDVSYEDIDETPWEEPDFDLVPIDLDALDDELEPETRDEATGALLDTIADLSEEIDEGGTPSEPEAEAPAVEEADEGRAPSEPEAEAPASEESPGAATKALLETIADLSEEVDEGGAPEARDEATGALLDAVADLSQEVDEEAAAAEAQESEETQVEEAETPAVVEPVEEESSIAAADVIEEPEEAPEAEEAPMVAEEVSAEIPAPAPPSAEEEPSPPAPPDMLYRVMIRLPPELAEQVDRLRAIGEIEGAPPPGIDLSPVFRAADRAAVEEVLSDWARNHLPLQLETTGVLAEVIGTQQYVAAWALDPQEELEEAQQDLKRALEPVVTLPADQAETFPVRVIIGDAVAPGPYPLVIIDMQREFEPYVWDAELVTLLHITMGEEGSAWEEAATFR